MTHRRNIDKILARNLNVGGKPWMGYVIHTKLMYAKFSHPMQKMSGDISAGGRGVGDGGE